MEPMERSKYSTALTASDRDIVEEFPDSAMRVLRNAMPPLCLAWIQNIEFLLELNFPRIRCERTVQSGFPYLDGQIECISKRDFLCLFFFA
jgi:hypothetical protein